MSLEHIDKIRGVILLGDDQQLEPVDTSSKRNAVYSAFPGRKRISFFARLKRQGFPYIELKEQHRMNHHIAKFVIENFYSGDIRNAPEMMVCLNEDEPGLQACLRQVLRDKRGIPDLELDDGDLRLHYLQITGTRISEPPRYSSVVREHIQVFFNEVFWYLHEYYQEHMADNVMIIAAYGEAVRFWKEASAFIQRNYKLSDNEVPSVCQMPEIVTIDSSQGREADVVFLDCSVQNPWNLGFVDDDKRMNVAFSRARKVLWHLGGNCTTGPDRAALVRYAKFLASEGRVLNMRNTLIQEPGSGWIDGLEKKEVKLDVRYKVDDADSAYYSAVEAVEAVEDASDGGSGSSA